MEEETDSSQFVPGSLVSLRRTSTGSLNSLKRSSNSHLHDCSTCSTYQSLNLRCRHTPIAGGSWDDNSVGHGSVAARMRRERNRVIRQTKSNTPYVTHTKDTHANLTSTLNLINTTSLSPWTQHDNKLPWDDCYGLSDDFTHPRTAASKRSAGSLCNIPSTGSSHFWDSCPVSDYSKTRSTNRTSYRHSYTSANHHSSPTSGCASMAGSDIDSTDLAFFSMTDDSSLFDADSLFSDSYGVIDTSSDFSTNIMSLLEEGTISCRTPFLNGDWPDSISELDFDCSEQQNEISNCDAHSDIGPSCSVPTERNRLKKRQNRSQTDETPKSFQMPTGSCDVVPQVPIDITESSSVHNDMPSTVPLTPVMPPTEDIIPVERSLLPPIHCCPTYIPEDMVDVDSFIAPAQSVLYMTNMEKDTKTDSRCCVRPETRPSSVIPPMPSLKSLSPEPIIAAMQFDEDFDSHTVVNCEVNDMNIIEPVDMTLTSSLDNWNSLPKEKKLGFVEQLSERITKTMGLQEQLDIIQIIGANDKCQIPFRMSIDDIDSHKLSRVLGYLDTHKSTDTSSSSSKLDTQKPTPPESNLRRSNSDGNIAKSLSDAQKEQRRRQRQARRFAKWLKQRQRKENRQHLKEQRSGLFVNEKKVKIQVENESEEEVEIDI